MSTAYRCEPALNFATFIRSLPHAGLKEAANEVATETTRFIQLDAGDGGGLWAISTNQGTDTAFERFGSQPDAHEIAYRIMAFFAVELISEHDDRFFTESGIDSSEWEAEFPGCTVTVTEEDAHRVIEFANEIDMQRFLDTVGGAPHPLGGIRVVLN